MKKMFKKCSTDQRFIRKRNTAYEIGTLEHFFLTVVHNNFGNKILLAPYLAENRTKKF